LPSTYKQGAQKVHAARSIADSLALQEQDGLRSKQESMAAFTMRDLKRKRGCRP